MIKEVKIHKVTGFLTLVALVLAACGPAVTQQPPVTVSPSASVPQPTVPSPTATREVDPRARQIEQLVSQVLQQQLHIEFDKVTVVSVEQAEWPDACLGVRLEGLVCAQVVTPGYRVVLEAQGERYEYHSDASGSNIVLAVAPTPEIPDAAVVWTGESDAGCRTAVLGNETVAFGRCGGALMGGKYARPDRVEAFTHFIETYAPFEAATPAGTVTFTGQGANQASPAEQRMIAEWARLAELEAEAGRSGASYGLAFAWHREGGIAGFCDSLEVYVTGDAYAASCAGEAPQDLGGGRLSAEQLEQVYAWMDELQAFEMEHTDDAIADAMSIRLVFSGAGSAEATEDDIQALQDLAAQLFARLSGAEGEDAAFVAWLKETLAARDYDQLRALMGETFAIAGWRSEGQFYSPDEAIVQLQNIYLGPDTALVFPERDLHGLLGGIDPLSIVGPEVGAVRAVYVEGWGFEGRDEALLYIAQRPDSTHYWYSVLFAEGGFGQPASPDEVLETDVQYVLALEDVAMYSGPADTYDLIGGVFDGQIALVTGVSADGGWWRVICPDDTVGSCWVSADPQLMLPTAPPAPGDPAGGQ